MDVYVMLDKLELLTKQMDIPEFRRRSPLWLSRNMAIRNSNHPNFQEAKELISILLRKNVI